MNTIAKTYEEAKSRYAELGVDTDAALKTLNSTQISLHCWQGDDVTGFEAMGEALSGGIMTTGNYPGRARTPDELRQDMAKAYSLIPGRHRANIHAMYLETGGAKVDRDAIEPAHFEGWMQWADDMGVKLDFNPSLFSHPKAVGYTLAHYDKGVREFWIEHAVRCRAIANEMGKRQGAPCVINHWMIDGCKEAPVDRLRRRELFVESLDKIIEKKYAKDRVLDSVESKLFGIGLENFTCGSNELTLAYAITRGIMATFDMGHFHPMEIVADKISSALLFLDNILTHVSRPARWDSDHIVIRNDDVDLLMQEIVRADALSRTYIALDYFDASVNRVAAWVIGTRAALRSILAAALEPKTLLSDEEMSGDPTWRLAILDGIKDYPFAAVWDYYCERENVPTGLNWMNDVKEYYRAVQSLRV